MKKFWLGLILFFVIIVVGLYLYIQRSHEAKIIYVNEVHEELIDSLKQAFPEVQSEE